MMLDNRTGRMWDKGVVNCYEAVSRSEKDQRGGMSSLRMNAIGKAFKSPRRVGLAHHGIVPALLAEIWKR